jgi:hypothetical protein
MSSRDMLNDQNKMNFINPFAVTGPGAWSNPYPFAAKGPPVKEHVEKPEPSPACLANITASGCSAPINPVSCPLNRPLEPTREIEPDLVSSGYLDSLYGTKLIPREAPVILAPRYGGAPHLLKKSMTVPLVLLSIFLLAMLYSIL